MGRVAEHYAGLTVMTSAGRSLYTLVAVIRTMAEHIAVMMRFPQTAVDTQRLLSVADG